MVTMNGLERISDNERIWQCQNCGQACQGWHAANEWFLCDCGRWDPVELTDQEYAEAYPWRGGERG